MIRPPRPHGRRGGLLWEGDRLDLSRMRCIPYDRVICGHVLAALGGLQFVLPGRSATIDLASTPDREALAPDIITAIVNGKNPPQLTAKRLMRLTPQIPVDWAEQRRLLGFQ